MSSSADLTRFWNVHHNSGRKTRTSAFHRCRFRRPSASEWSVRPVRHELVVGSPRERHTHQRRFLRPVLSPSRRPIHLSLLVAIKFHELVHDVFFHLQFPPFLRIERPSGRGVRAPVLALHNFTRVFRWRSLAAVAIASVQVFLESLRHRCHNELRVTATHASSSTALWFSTSVNRHVPVFSVAFSPPFSAWHRCFGINAGRICAVERYWRLALQKQALIRRYFLKQKKIQCE